MPLSQETALSAAMNLVESVVFNSLMERNALIVRQNMPTRRLANHISPLELALYLD